MKIFHMVQGSGDWWEARRGLVTASNADRILTPGGKPSAQQADYVAEVLGDTLCLTPNFFTETPMSPAMRHGRDTEPEARRWYTMETGREVQMVGGCLSDCGRFWASPDGLFEGGSLELKCPLPKTQVRYVLDGVLPKDYLPQVHFQLIVTKLPCVEFLSYCPGLPPLVVRQEPDAYTRLLTDELERFHEKFEAAKRKIGVAV